MFVTLAPHRNLFSLGTLAGMFRCTTLRIQAVSNEHDIQPVEIRDHVAYFDGDGAERLAQHLRGPDPPGGGKFSGILSNETDR